MATPPAALRIGTSAVSMLNPAPLPHPSLAHPHSLSRSEVHDRSIYEQLDTKRNEVHVALHG